MSYMVIDITKVEETKFIAIAGLREAGAIGRLAKAEGKEVLAPPVEARGFSKMEKLQCQYLYWNTVQQTPPDDYEQLLQALLEIAKRLPVDTRPLSELEAAVRVAYPDEGKTQQTAQKPRQPASSSGATVAPPKQGSTTGKVWVIADEILASKFAGIAVDRLDWKAVRPFVISKCEAYGINQATAATQYSKWKASKLNAKSS